MHFRTTGSAYTSGGRSLKSFNNRDSLIFPFLSLDEGDWGRPAPEIKNAVTI